MRLLLDTHVLIALLRREIPNVNAPIADLLLSGNHVLFASAVSTWEMAIKARLGKLDPGVAIEEIPDLLQTIGLTLLPVTPSQTVRLVTPEPATRDPFDRLLLAQCLVEDLLLVTIDQALSSHPLAWRPA